MPENNLIKVNYEPIKFGDVVYLKSNPEVKMVAEEIVTERDPATQDDFVTAVHCTWMDSDRHVCHELFEVELLIKEQICPSN